jgi:hypothetical protein
MTRRHRRGQRYECGQTVYVRGWGPLQTARVTAVLTIRGWPWYEVLATTDASVWIIPRIHLSTIPISIIDQ